MFCNNCGKELRDGAKFCPACGIPVQTESAPAEETPLCAEEQPAVGTIILRFLMVFSTDPPVTENPNKPIAYLLYNYITHRNYCQHDFYIHKEIFRENECRNL